MNRSQGQPLPNTKGGQGNNRSPVFENRINSRSEAIRRLIAEALRKYENKARILPFVITC